MIVPVLNEVKHLPALLPRLTSQADRVIVVDSGSTDGSIEAAEAVPGVQVLVSGPPRWRQMNLGAGETSARTLLFLHADTRPPRAFAGIIRDALDDHRVVGGAFALHVDDDSPWARLVSTGANWRTWLTGHPYGDQGLFVRRHVYEAMGGFAACSIMEDLEFSARLRRRGKVSLLRQKIHVSPRRWLEQGYLRTTWRNTVLAGCFYAGADTGRFSRWLAPVRDSGETAGES